MEQCRKWCHDANLRTQIQKRVMAAAIMLIAEKKTVYTPNELSVLAQIGGSLKGRDVFVLAAIVAILQILTKHLNQLPPDPQTAHACKEVLNTPDIFSSRRLQEARTKFEQFVACV